MNFFRAVAIGNKKGSKEMNLASGSRVEFYVKGARQTGVEQSDERRSEGGLRGSMIGPYGSSHCPSSRIEEPTTLFKRAKKLNYDGSRLVTSICSLYLTMLGNNLRLDGHR